MSQSIQSAAPMGSAAPPLTEGPAAAGAPEAASAPDLPLIEVPALVIGAGPAGLMAAERLSAAGHAVLIAEAKPSPARKFLMAGKSGLNLTKDEPDERFLARYGESAGVLAPILAQFGPQEVIRWAQDLGQEVFTGSTGRVFPVAMKASPLLRAWLARLEAQGARLKRQWRWCGWDGDLAKFDTPEGPQSVRAGVTVLALGGASWARLGSDGAWTQALAGAGQPLAPFQPSNAGLILSWSAHMQPLLGQPVKNVGLIIGGSCHRGEFVLSARGLEGGGIYPLTPLLRQGLPLALDLAPDTSLAALTAKLGGKPGQSLSNRLRRAGLPPVALALAQEFGRPLPAEAGALAARLKELPVPHQGLRPLDEAISTAGGLCFDGLTAQLELRHRPGVFAAGEMLDWDAPTGGYLLTACLATGRHAGLAAAARLAAE